METCMCRLNMPANYEEIRADEIEYTGAGVSGVLAMIAIVFMVLSCICGMICLGTAIAAGEAVTLTQRMIVTEISTYAVIFGSVGLLSAAGSGIAYAVS